MRRETLIYILLQFSRDDIGEDLEFAVTMSAETCVWFDAIFVYDTKRCKFHMQWILVPKQQQLREL